MIYKDNKIFFIAGTFLVFVLVAFFATYHLSESPRTWTDEGILVQTTKNLAELGQYKTQIGPNEYVSSDYVTTGCPVLCPVALAFKIFGSNLLVARSVMAFFILLMSVVIYLLLRKFVSPKNYLLPFLLLVTFPPVYGHGKNVLGEIPGLFFLLTSIYMVYIIERKERVNFFDYIVFGLFAGLTLSTKPIYLLLGPIFLFVLFLLWYRQKINFQGIIISFVAFFVPIIGWLLTQFWGSNLAVISSLYLNPNNVNPLESVQNNLRSILHFGQPLYVFLIFGVWLMAVGYRLYKRQQISAAEIFSFLFSLFTLISYLRMASYYRYFFSAQMVCLLSFLPSIKVLIQNLSKKNYIKAISMIFIFILCLVQIYSLMFSSWVANYYQSRMTSFLQNEIKQITLGKSVFVYQAPEIVIFLPHHNYWQYLVPAPSIKLGEEKLGLISSGKPDLIINRGDIDVNFLVKDHYRLSREFYYYQVWSKI